MIGWGACYGLQGSGDFKTPMYAMLIATGVNLILDPILILGWGPFPRLGINGAALATITAQFTGFFIIIKRVFHKDSPVKFSILSGEKPDLQLLRRLFKIGLPAGIQTLILFVCILILMNKVSQLGDSKIAAITVAIRCLILIGIPAMALSEAVTTITGQAIGARKYLRSILTTHSAFIIGLISTAILSILGLVFSETIIGFFADFENKTDSVEVMHNGVVALRYIIGVVMLWLPILIYGGAFKGAGDTWPPMMVGFLRAGLILILPSLVIHPSPYHNIFIATLISFGIESAILYVWFVRRLWIGFIRKRIGG
jgi:putative MATE family efflux protein